MSPKDYSNVFGAALIAAMFVAASLAPSLTVPALAEDAAKTGTTKPDATTTDSSGTDAEKQDTAQAEKPPAWREFHFSERGFVASFPGTAEKPKATSTPVPGQNPLLQHEYKVKTGKDSVFAVVVFEYPEGRAPNPPKNDYFEKVVKAYAKGSDTKLRSKTPIQINERPGYEAKAEDSRGKLNHLITMVANGDRIYMIVSAGPKKHANSDDALKFRDNFRLLGGPAPEKPKSEQQKSEDSE